MARRLVKSVVAVAIALPLLLALSGCGNGDARRPGGSQDSAAKSATGGAMENRQNGTEEIHTDSGGNSSSTANREDAGKAGSAAKSATGGARGNRRNGAEESHTDSGGNSSSTANKEGVGKADSARNDGVDEQESGLDARAAKAQRRGGSSLWWLWLALGLCGGAAGMWYLQKRLLDLQGQKEREEGRREEERSFEKLEKEKSELEDELKKKQRELQEADEREQKLRKELSAYQEQATKQEAAANQAKEEPKARTFWLGNKMGKRFKDFEDRKDARRTFYLAKTEDGQRAEFWFAGDTQQARENYNAVFDEVSVTEGKLSTKVEGLEHGEVKLVEEKIWEVTKPVRLKLS